MPDLAQWLQGRDSHAACAPESAEGPSGKSHSSAVVTTSANSFSSTRSHALKMKKTARPEDSARLRKRFCLVGEEHGSELAHHGVERAIFERQLHGVCLTPLHGSPGPDCGGQVQHGSIQIRGDNRDAFRQHTCQIAGYNAGAGGYLEYSTDGSRSQPIHQIFGVGFEDQRNQILFIELSESSP